MADELTFKLEPPPKEYEDLIARLQKQLKIGVGEAVRWAAWYLSKSLSSSTKTAPKKRRLLKTKKADIKAGFDASKTPYYVKVYAGDGVAYKHYLKAGAEEFDPDRFISRHGLAGSSWGWMVSDLGRSVPTTQPKMKGATKVTRMGDVWNPGWKLENKIGYIETIMRTSGRRAIETAYARAVKNANNKLDNRWRKA